jgi:uncharacterized protein (DUF4415 family)
MVVFGMPMPKKKAPTKTPFVDPDDAPGLTPEWFSDADLRVRETIVRRRGRPRSEWPKKLVSLRLSPEFIDTAKALGAGWQTPINDILEEALLRKPRRRTVDPSRKRRAAG